MNNFIITTILSLSVLTLNAQDNDFSFPLEVNTGYIDFNKDSGLQDMWYVGGSTGFNFTDNGGIRGYYWKGMKDSEFNFDFDEIEIYGLESRVSIPITQVARPYLVLGGGLVKPYGNYVGTNNLPTTDNKFFGTAGAGLDLRFINFISVTGYVRSMIMNFEQLNTIDQPENEISSSWNYGASINFRIGDRKSGKLISNEKSNVPMPQEATSAKLEASATDSENKVVKSNSNNIAISDEKRLGEIDVRITALEAEPAQLTSENKSESTNSNDNQNKKEVRVKKDVDVQKEANLQKETVVRKDADVQKEVENKKIAEFTNEELVNGIDSLENRINEYAISLGIDDRSTTTVSKDINLENLESQRDSIKLKLKNLSENHSDVVSQLELEVERLEQQNLEIDSVNNNPQVQRTVTRSLPQENRTLVEPQTTSQSLPLSSVQLRGTNRSTNTPVLSPTQPTGNINRGTAPILFPQINQTPTTTTDPDAPIDTDKDGITDEIDECPNEMGVMSNNGCPEKQTKEPEPVEEPQIEPIEVENTEPEPLSVEPTTQAAEVEPVIEEVVETPEIKKETVTEPPKESEAKIVEIERTLDSYSHSVFFNTNSDVITGNSEIHLDEIYNIMIQYPNELFIVEGHTDNTGNEELNKALSQKRAKSVVDYLINKGISSSKLSSIGFGEENPIATNDTAEGRKQNRRVVIRVK